MDDNTVANLLAPIGEPEPTGADVREGGAGGAAYREMRDAQKMATSAERSSLRGVVSDPPPDVLWGTVSERAQSILREHSKDMEVAATLIQALARTGGFGGLRSGFELCAGLVRDFWPALHPQSDDDEDLDEDHGPGVLARAEPVSQLDAEEALSAPMLRQPVVEGLGSDAPEFWQVKLEMARKPAADDDDTSHAESAELAAIRSLLAGVPQQVLVARRSEIAACRDAYLAMIEAINQACEASAEAASEAQGTRVRAYRLSSSRTEATLDDCLQMFDLLTAGMLPVVSDDAAAPAPAGEVVAAGPAGTPAAASTRAGGLASREQAFAEIDRIARYFETSEPHSPISFLLRQAVRWGRMSLPDLMSELMASDTTARDDYFRVTGIPKAEDENG
ncbi:MAG: type VI secretion system protein TssA [Alphaproteobacteria bacterium]|nr:type VI secretion system protein TssA [Alphaproteobacteria bacterium]